MGITLVGLGVKSGDISVDALNAVRNADEVFVRTEKTASAAYLKDNSVDYRSFDGLYESSRSFTTLCKKIASSLNKEAKNGKNVVYAVDGSVSEDLSCSLVMRSTKNVRVYEGVSKTANAVAACGLSGEGYTAVSAYRKKLGAFSCPLVIFDLDDRVLASEWKIELFKFFGEETPVNLLIGGVLKKIRLFELDTFDNFDYSAVLVIGGTELMKKERFSIGDLFDILYILRGENGCPWDRVQTKESIRENMIEEAYELVDAIDLNDDDKMREEIGDVLMQAAFHTLFAEERGAFSREDVVTELCKKLISRHTHVFGKDEAASGEAALALWNKNKQKEKGFDNVYDYVSAVPIVFPSLMRAQKTFKRADSYGYSATDVSLGRVMALLDEFEKGDVSAKDAGELLFVVAALLKQRGVSAEEALADYTKAYVEDLKRVEDALKEKGLTLSQAKKEDISKLYDEVKKS